MEYNHSSDKARGAQKGESARDMTEGEADMMNRGRGQEGDTTHWDEYENSWRTCPQQMDEEPRLADRPSHSSMSEVTLGLFQTNNYRPAWRTFFKNQRRGHVNRLRNTVPLW
ncbi:hypothetical protein CEXT_412171 [Caerostris extrusa]|uniref:Uncharacterized protein n=1 Tax=Caerostris extrusa TaxID=172846 RepID=A0AAV4QWH7_CAEEX|nr:hypothetical protein CEXT_412171 [Caerostris extrusa]